MSRPTVVTVCMFGSSESWGLNSTHYLWHSCAGGGAVHSINSGNPKLIGDAAGEAHEYWCQGDNSLGGIPPPLVIRAFRAHCQNQTFGHLRAKTPRNVLSLPRAWGSRLVLRGDPPEHRPSRSQGGRA